MLKEPLEVIERQRQTTEVVLFDDENVKKHEKSTQEINLTPSDDSIQIDDGETTSDTEDSKNILSFSDDGNDSKTHDKKKLPFNWKMCWLFIFPAICDTAATSSMYVGLALTSASSYQMLRGSVIIFTGLASRIVLR